MSDLVGHPEDQFSQNEAQCMAGPSKFGAIRNSGYFSCLSISHFGEVLELPFLAEMKTTCLHLNMVYKMYMSCNFE